MLDERRSEGGERTLKQWEEDGAIENRNVSFFTLHLAFFFPSRLLRRRRRKCLRNNVDCQLQEGFFPCVSGMLLVARSPGA